MASPRNSTPLRVAVHDLGHDGRGVARHDGKTLFIAGALPGETVECRVHTRHARFDEAATVAVLDASPDRREPRCAHAGSCGGCALQHLDVAAQTRFKQQRLAQALQRIGGVTPARWLDPLTGECWGYRARARFAVTGTGDGITLGYRRAESRQVVDIRECPVLDPALEPMIAPLHAMLATLERPRAVREILVACGDAAPDVARAACVLTDGPLGETDRVMLAEFGASEKYAIYLEVDAQPPTRLWPAHDNTLHYDLDGLHLAFQPWHFTQTNRAINRALAARLVDLLAPSADDTVLDLFCGIGNFTLPLARHAREITGVDGDAAALAQARANATENRVENAQFTLANLFAEPAAIRALPRPGLVLIDPPRAGAAALMPELARLRPRRLCYVSCDAATLARDARTLVEDHGARLDCAGMLDMFPHTRHFESVALFTFRGKPKATR